jgi:hypothetical protein
MAVIQSPYNDFLSLQGGTVAGPLTVTGTTTLGGPNVLNGTTSWVTAAGTTTTFEGYTQFNAGFTVFSSNATFLGNAVITGGSLDITSLGSGISIATGANAKMGTGSLSAGGGVGTVLNTSVTAASVIFITDTSAGGVVNVGNLAVISQSAGTSFVVKSTNAADVSTFNYLIMEPG